MIVVPEFSATLCLSSEMLTPGPSVPAAEMLFSDSDVVNKNGCVKDRYTKETMFLISSY